VNTVRIVLKNFGGAVTLVYIEINHQNFPSPPLLLYKPGRYRQVVENAKTRPKITMGVMCSPGSVAGYTRVPRPA
jgi:hypothetical protein